MTSCPTGQGEQTSWDSAVGHSPTVGQSHSAAGVAAGGSWALVVTSTAVTQGQARQWVCGVASAAKGTKHSCSCGVAQARVECQSSEARLGSPGQDLFLLLGSPTCTVLGAGSPALAEPLKRLPQLAPGGPQPEAEYSCRRGPSCVWLQCDSHNSSLTGLSLFSNQWRIALDLCDCFV